jgi:tRNA threonylcarbamoyl adenosine modification protein YeaZ
MNSFAFDCSTEYLFAAVRTSKGLFPLEKKTGFQHTTTLLPTIQLLLESSGLKASDLNALYVTRGPGSFTGLRIALSTAKGLQSALNIPLYAPLTLDAMAAESARLSHGSSDRLTVALLFGKRQRYFARGYRQGQPVTEVLDRAADDIYREFGPEAPYWTGPSAYDFLKELGKAGEEHSVSGSWLKGILSEGDRLHSAEETLASEEGPLYFRLSEAEETLRGSGKD